MPSAVFIPKDTNSISNNESVTVAPGNAPLLAVVIVTEVISGHGWSDAEVRKLYVAQLIRMGGERNF